MNMPSAACLALAVWLLLGEPLYGRRSHRHLLAALDAGQGDARLRFYRRWTVLAWVLAAVTALVARAKGWSAVRLGLQWPHSALLDNGMLGGFLSALLGGLVLGVLLARRKPARPAKPRMAGGDNVLRLLPHGRRERWGFAALALTAGLTEEWIWRGFGAAALHAVWPALGLAPTVIVLALAFGWAHLYQGLAGVLVTAVLGGLLAWLYLSTASLLLPMLLHVLIDLRALLVPVGAGTVAGAFHATDVQTSIQDRGNP